MEEKEIQQNEEVQQEECCKHKKGGFKDLKHRASKAEAALAEKDKAIEELKKALAGKEASLAKEKNDYLLLMAEFENFRRRTAAERLEMISTASEKIILEILPVLDDFERAVKALEGDRSGAQEGAQLIYTKLLNILKAKGLKQIEATGKDFDTDVMEAVAQCPVQEDEQKGKVFDVVQNGYKLGEKVIRFAKVVVGQ